MGKIITFFKGPGLILVILALLFTGAYFLRRHREKTQAEEAARAKKELTAKTLGSVNPQTRQVSPGAPLLRETVRGNDLVPAAANMPATPAPSAPATPVPAPQSVARTGDRPKLPKMIQTYSAPPLTRPEAKAPTLFAPSGTLIKCSLILTVDSSSLQTPVLAVITEDVWEHQRIIIPAGSLVYAFASKGHMRDRIDVTGAWNFVFRDGKEYRLNGIALDREIDTAQGGFGITDGSAGIKGQIIESDEYADLKVFLATAIGAVANNSLTTTNQGFGNSVTGSVQNVPLLGTQAVLDRYARRIEQSQEGDGTFVRVAAGTEFYIFPTAVVEPGLASVAALKQGKTAENSWELEQDRFNALTTQAAERAAAADSRDAGKDPTAAVLNDALKKREEIFKRAQTYIDAQKNLTNDPNLPILPQSPR